MKRIDSDILWSMYTSLNSKSLENIFAWAVSNETKRSIAYAYLNACSTLSSVCDEPYPTFETEKVLAFMLRDSIGRKILTIVNGEKNN